MIVLDPFDDTVGYDRIRLRADGLLITHNHFDHNFIKAVRPHRRAYDLVRTTGTVQVAGDITVTGIPSFHDNENGEINGPNIIFVFEMGGLRVAHLGDIGQDCLSPVQLSRMGHVDVLFIPVGGVTTIGPKKAKEYVDRIKPAFVFPMHYGDIRFFKLADVAEFTGLFPRNRVTIVDGSSVRLRRDRMPENGPQIFVLKPAKFND